MTNPLSINLPHLGSTGIVQQPGVGGAIAQGLQQLPQILLALQQQKLYEQQVQAQVGAMQQAQAAREEQARQEGSIGQAAQTLSAGATLGIPMPGQFAQTPVTVRPTVDQIVASLPSRDVSAFLNKNQALVQTKRGEEKAARDRQLLEKRIAKLDPDIQAGIRTVIDMGDSVPADVQSQVFQRLSHLASNPDQLRLFASFLDKGMSAKESAAAAGLNEVPGAPILSPDFRKPAGLDPMARIILGAQAGAVFGQPSDQENKNFTWFQRASLANQTLSDPNFKPPSTAEIAVVKRFPVLGPAVMSTLFNSKAGDWWQPVIQFSQAVLRKDTGATINAQEIEWVLSTYFDLPSDSEATKKRKAGARLAEIEALRRGATRVLTPPWERWNALQRGKKPTQGRPELEPLPPG